MRCNWQVDYERVVRYGGGGEGEVGRGEEKQARAHLRGRDDAAGLAVADGSTNVGIIKSVGSI